MTPEASRSASSTRCIHAGQSPDPATGAVMPPIYATSTYAQSSPGVHKGFEYSRTAEPDAHGLRALHRRPRGRHARLRLRVGHGGDGDAAGAARLPATTCVAMDDLYGGTFRLFERVRRRSPNLDFSFADLSDPKAPARRDRGRTRSMIWIETPTNPTAEARRHRAVARARARARHPRRRRQHLRHARGSSVRSSSAPTSSCTRRPSS